MSLDSISNRGERLMAIAVISGLLILLGLAVRTVYRVITGYYLRPAPPKRRKIKKRRVGAT